jgi:hypothetical protein
MTYTRETFLKYSSLKKVRCAICGKFIYTYKMPQMAQIGIEKIGHVFSVDLPC